MQAVQIAEDRPSYVRFERVAVEDKPASLAAGRYVAKDIDLALITPIGSKDIFKIRVPQWIENMKRDVAAERLPEKWMREYIAAYEHWKNGQDIPLNGTPIKGWGVISPAQQETLTRLHILTVEDLAAINGEAAQRIGMGAIELKNKAQAWLAQLKDKGPLTQEVAALKAENASLKVSIETLTAKFNELTEQVKATSTPVQVSVQDAETISLNDIIPETEKRGRRKD